MQRGMVAITSVLIMAFVMVAIVTTVTLLSIGEAQSGLAGVLGEGNLSLVEGCVEDVLQKFHDNAAYAGGNITRPEGTCVATVNSGSPNYDVTVNATGGDYSRRVQVQFTRGTSIVLTRWQEI